MKNMSTRKPSYFLRVACFAFLLACLATTLLATPGAHASSRNETIGTQRADSCTPFTYLGGSWPAQFQLAGCAIDAMQQYSGTVNDIKNVAIIGLEECSVACNISLNLFADLIHHEINHLADESQQCGDQGVFIHLYGIVFRSSLICGTTTDLPVLNSSYSNTSVRRQDGATFKETILIDSQDPEGNVTGRWLTVGITYSCQGSVTTSNDISLSCSSDNAFNFTGHLYSDGHIEGTSVGVDTGNTYDEYMS